MGYGTLMVHLLSIHGPPLQNRQGFSQTFISSTLLTLQTHRALPLHTEAAPSSHLLPFPSQWGFGGGGVALKLWPLSVESWAVEKRIEGFVSGDARISTMGMAAPQRFAAVLARPQCCRRSQRRGDHIVLVIWLISGLEVSLYSSPEYILVLYSMCIGIIGIEYTVDGHGPWDEVRLNGLTLRLLIAIEPLEVLCGVYIEAAKPLTDLLTGALCIGIGWFMEGVMEGATDRARIEMEFLIRLNSLLWSWRLALLILTSILTKVLIESKPSAIPASSQSSAAFLFN